MKKYSFSSLLSWLRPDYHTSSSSKLPLPNGVAPTAVAFTETEKRLIAKLRVEVSLHISFLRKIHTTGVSLTKPSDESIRRYVHLWLPLVVELQKEQALSSSSDNVDPDHPTEYCDKLLNCIIPPDYIAWLWHCHRLAPYLYLAYIQERFFGNVCRMSDAFSNQQIVSRCEAANDSSHGHALALRITRNIPMTERWYHHVQMRRHTGLTTKERWYHHGQMRRLHTRANCECVLYEFY
jgi:hypothetical protein